MSPQASYRNRRSLEVGDRRIGEGEPCFLIAEIGINHNGDMNLAREQIRLAAACGVDAVKFQNYRTQDFIFDRTLTLAYQSQGREIVEPQYDLFRRCELTRADLELLKASCDEQGVVFCSTPTGMESLSDLVEIGTLLLKNGSDYLGNLELVRAMGATGLPTILSTGMATASDIDEAVRVFRGTDNHKLALLHCVSAYPTPAHEVNLARMRTLWDAFDSIVGFSDHTAGVTAAALAAALGARIIEKHFTSDRDLAGPDHWFSSTPAELDELVRAVRDAERMLGSAALELSPLESRNRANHRLSCVARVGLRAGSRISVDDIVYRRPGFGLRPALRDYLVGRTLRHDVIAGHAFDLEDFE